MKPQPANRHSSSFRDPAGFVFVHKDVLYRQINQAGGKDFDHFIDSGLYHKLVDQDLIVKHQLIGDLPDFSPDPKRYKVIKPEPISFISYPYEWTFDQLKAAAGLTLKIQNLALEHGMILKDASAYNVQFVGRKPIFIDTLSFWKYKDGDAWEGYKQFCEHFVAPLAISSYISPEILKSLRVFLDGIPLNLAVKLLPGRARLTRGLLTHVYLHAASQRRYETPGKPASAARRRVSPMALGGLLSSLQATINRLKLSRRQTQWGDYYSNTNYSNEALKSKKKIVGQMLRSVSPAPKIVWDLGANDGTFSEMAAKTGAYTVAFDKDSLAVEQNYLKRDQLSEAILPLVQDLANPSPPLGWAHSERLSLVQRGPADVAMALALVHHLAITEHSPFTAIAKFFASICKFLIIEFVPKEDSNTQVLLSSFSHNMFAEYDREHFEAAFENYFSLQRLEAVTDSQRSIYLYKTKA